MKTKKVVRLSMLLIFLGMAGVSYAYEATIKKSLIKIYREYFVDRSNPYIKEGGEGWGIDLSHHQRSVDWNKLVEKNRPDFIFLKTTEGSTHIDTKYSEYLKKSRELDIPVGAYHFFSYHSNGKSQAKHFIKNAKLIKGDIYPVLDVEFGKGMKDKTWIISEIKSYCHEIKREYGVYPIIYCECDYYKKYLKKDFDDLHYWISDLVREPWCNYVIWQYTAAGHVHGIGKIDNNKLHPSKNISNLIL